MRIMVENPEYRALIQVVSGLSEAEQREIVAKYQPTETYLCKTPADFEAFLKQMRPPRVAVVAYAGLLGEQHGSKAARVDSMIAMKVGIHKRLGYAVEAATGRQSDKTWEPMKRDGEEMCRRLAQGRQSALNGRRGSQPFEFANKHLSRFVIEMGKGKNDADRLARIAAYCKREKINMPKRTWLKAKLPVLASARGLV